MRTKIQSDSTRVPPVTDEKSPPDSRITGADSPVMALSSTDATPAITWPSPGMVSPASTSTTSPRRSPEGWLTAWPRHASGVARLASASLNPLSRRASMVVRRPRKVGLLLAAAFGQGFGEVGEQHGEPEPYRDRQDEARRGLGRAAP